MLHCWIWMWGCWIWFAKVIIAFQQDNAPAHRCHLTRLLYLRDNGILLYYGLTPPQSNWEHMGCYEKAYLQRKPNKFAIIVSQYLLYVPGWLYLRILSKHSLILCWRESSDKSRSRPGIPDTKSLVFFGDFTHMTKQEKLVAFGMPPRTLWWLFGLYIPFFTKLDYVRFICFWGLKCRCWFLNQEYATSKATK